MRALLDVTPTPEQLALFSRIRPGVEVIRGAAGSGKTTTALLKLRAAVASYGSRKRRLGISEPVRVLVLTFNRTLRGYVAELAKQQIDVGADIELEIDTFSRWAHKLLGHPALIEEEEAERVIWKAAAPLGLGNPFAIEESRYVMERYMPNDLLKYVNSRREGRGNLPRMEGPLRQALLDQVIHTYAKYKSDTGQFDWNDLAVRLAQEKRATYDIVIIDETQDFSANEVRAVLNQLSQDFTATFVLDSTQRIYPRSFKWGEVGVLVRPENSHKLTSNYRNTRQIARFAASILDGMTADDDGTMPDFNSATRNGDLPTVVTANGFAQQANFAIAKIRGIDLTKESVAFLHPKGGGWFKELKKRLDEADLDYVSISRKSDWPEGDENIALSTLHSAKGLEFDHIFMIGLNAEVLPVGLEEGIPDAERSNAIRRLVAMGVGRARKTVTIGYKLSDAPGVAEFFDHAACTRVEL